MKFSFPQGKTSFILWAENIIDPEICEDIIAECRKNYNVAFSPGPTMGGVDTSTKSSMDFNWSHGCLVDLGLPTQPLTAYEHTVATAIWSAVAFYRESYRWLWHWPYITDTGFRLQHYQRNVGFYREHIDGGHGSLSASKRVLGVVVYLNDVEVGGETYFPLHDLYIPAKRGSISVFPANWTHPHQGCVPLSGDKWMVSTFIEWADPPGAPWDANESEWSKTANQMYEKFGSSQTNEELLKAVENQTKMTGNEHLL